MKKLLFTLALLIGIVTITNANTGLLNAEKTMEATLGLTIAAGGFLGKKAMQEIENAANGGLSNYEEDYEDNYEDDYDGDGDDFVDFGGKGVNFTNEARRGRSMQMTFVNATGADHEIIICPSFIDATYLGVPANGVARNGLFPSVAGVADAITGTGRPQKIEHIFRAVHETPIRVTGFRLTSSGANATAAIDEMKLVIQEIGLFRNLGDREIVPSHYKSESNYQNNILTVPEGFDMNDQTRITVNIKANSTVVFTLLVGASLNSAKALEKKAGRAGKSHRK